jgi:predicted RNA methylase
MLSTLKAIVEKLIEMPLNYGSARAAANELYNFFKGLASAENDHDKIYKHIETNHGLAISTDAAAFCVIDFLRTRQFILAIKQAIVDKSTVYIDTPIIILYAGTGPFASLLVPLTTLFTPAQIQFILLEINTESIEQLKKVIDKLAIQDYIIDVVHADASTYRFADGIKADILVSETMKPALDKEPQISIISNLIGQCKTDVTLIPESIKIDLAYIRRHEEDMHRYEPICELMNFDGNLAKTLHNDKNKSPIFSEGVVVHIDAIPLHEFSKISFLTTINLYKNLLLGYKETSLTIPFTIKNVEALDLPVSLKIRYNIGKHPGFIVEKIMN